VILSETSNQPLNILFVFIILSFVIIYYFIILKF